MKTTLINAVKGAAKQRWLNTYEKLQTVRVKSAKLAAEERELLEELRSLAEAYNLLTGESLGLTPEQTILTRDVVSIGDTLEAMLKERGPLGKHEILEEFERTGRIVGKNARVILANAIKRDKKMRFKVEEGKVALTDGEDRILLDALRMARFPGRIPPKKGKK